MIYPIQTQPDGLGTPEIRVAFLSGPSGKRL